MAPDMGLFARNFWVKNFESGNKLNFFLCKKIDKIEMFGKWGIQQMAPNVGLWQKILGKNLGDFIY